MDFRGLSAQGCLVMYQGRFGGLEGIMNCAAATAFLPNFVGFPSPRGLHSSTVQRRSAPGARRRPSALVGRRAPSCWDAPPAGSPVAAPAAELGCPVSAASAATAPAARGPASAGRASARRVTPAGVPPATVVPAAVVAAGRASGRTGRRGTTRAAGPPAAVAATPAPGGTALLPAVLAPADGPHDHNEQDDRQDDADDHGVTLLPFPRSGPPWAVFLGSSLACQGDAPTLPAPKQS